LTKQQFHNSIIFYKHRQGHGNDLNITYVKQWSGEDIVVSSQLVTIETLFKQTYKHNSEINVRIRWFTTGLKGHLCFDVCCTKS